MNTIKHKNLFYVMMVGVLLSLSLFGCMDKKAPVEPVIQDNSGNSASLEKSSLFNNNFLNYAQVDLVSDVPGNTGARVDPMLVNAWGIAVSPTGIFWISANHTGVSTVYDATGAQKLSPVTIPTVGNVPGGAPTGALFNYTGVFNLPGTSTPSRFIFVGEDGIVSAWGPSTGATAVVAADQSGNDAVYKGATIARFNGNYYLYAANFKQAKIDVFDQNFNIVTRMRFSDPNIPQGYAPFNIKDIAGLLFVTYAKQKGPDNEDDEAGPGNGYVDVYTSGGFLLTRFASRGNLNSPWGIAVGPSRFGRFAGSVLIGNFGDGRINAFNFFGGFIGQLKDNAGAPITINGLWALYSFDINTIRDLGMLRTENADKIYFTAGPDEETHGLFGYLQSQPHKPVTASVQK